MEQNYNDFFIKLYEGNIAVRDYGGSGKDILLVHGTGHNVEAWQLLANILNKKYHIWAFDLRGHGQTSVNSKNCLQYWQDIDIILKELKIKPELLIGHSIGGYSILAYTAWKNSEIPILILDDFVLDKFTEKTKEQPSKIDKKAVFDLFKLGWEADEA